MEETIFSKIINGDIPCHKVYEDEHTFAFMDIRPIQPGMVVVVSKQPIDHFMDLDESDYTALMLTVRKIARRMHEVFPDKRVAVQIEGLEVPHAHVKLFPIASSADFHAKQPGEDTTIDHDALTDMAKSLRIA